MRKVKWELLSRDYTSFRYFKVMELEMIVTVFRCRSVDCRVVGDGFYWIHIGNDSKRV